MKEIFSSGGGTQSACIAALIIQGRLPNPDWIVISDTERERPAVWLYHEQVIVPELEKHGMTIHRIPKSRFATVDIWAKGKGGTILPVFRIGSGQSATHCSNEWKRRVINRFLRSNGVPTNEQRLWMGYSLDEANRYTAMKWSKEGLKNLCRFPLVEDVPLRRRDAIRVVEDMGWPTPPRSACWMCPNQSGNEWRDLKVNWPDAFQKAVVLEREVRQKESNAFFHPARIPLDQIDFGNEEDLFERHPCNSGMCFV